MKLLVVVAALALCGCASAPDPVRLESDWPGQAPKDYYEVTDAWTRSGKLIAPFDEGASKLLDVSATFQSPEWRSAYIAFRAKRELWPAPKREQQLAEQRAADEKFYEVTLLVATHTFRENDLQKGKRSLWRLALVDGSGNEVEPVEIESIRMPYEFMRTYFPKTTRDHEFYVARFPREAVDVYSAAANRFSLKMASIRGGVELIWKAQR